MSKYTNIFSQTLSLEYELLVRASRDSIVVGASVIMGNRNVLHYISVCGIVIHFGIDCMNTQQILFCYVVSLPINGYKLKFRNFQSIINVTC